MDVQLKRGLIEVCVLKVLMHGDSYGYQIIKDVSQYMDMSESTLYPVLKRLESSEMLTVYSIEYNSRLRKYYKITDSGKERIKDFLLEWEDVMKIYQFVKDGADNE